MSAEYNESKRKRWKKRWKKFFGSRAASPAPSATLSTDLYAPPSPSAAAAKAAQPRTSPRAPNDHQPHAASQTLPPALAAEPAPKPPPTECTEPPTPTLSVSERLWNRAYDSLEMDNAELVISYLKTLEKVLGANPGVAPNTNILAEFHDPTKRQMHMRRLNPARATKSNLAGIAHVISRMDWYCAPTEHPLNKNNIAGGCDVQAVLHQLEGTVVELYKALLLYQMKSPRRLLWIKGYAGTGETMLMIGLIRQLSHQPVALSPALSFFFCQGTDTALNNATVVLRFLIWLLLLQQPCLISHLLQKYKDSSADLFRDKNAFIALSDAFRNMLKDPKLFPVYLAVDALDECAQGRSDLFSLISTSLNLSQKVRWLLSSRPEVDLLSELKDPGTISPDASKSLVELDTQRLEDPVNAFIHYKLNTLRHRQGYNDRVLAEVSREVRGRAKNTFLWVVLAFKVLETVHGGYAAEIITEIPPGLSELYDHMMTRIEGGHIIKPRDCKTVLVVTSLAFRPLSIPELSVLADLPSDVAETAIEMCGSFLTATKGTVNLIHQSAKDYLTKNYKSRLQLAGAGQGHSDIVRRSTDATSSMLKRNIYDLDHGFKPENMAPPDPDPLAPIRYLCVFWADHLYSLNSDKAGFLGELTDDGKVTKSS
ncbi:hypothetical protein CHGG_09443 [Chaetomium globosum CBS 148.51]|uniref:NACHT domain-containing protein n=1 Tax=Chaetomium globosum (strain ATCC 6205 / CBS 148.51 / DSM 1962 / NBRC 6347 / NRRL 1970) TaxID=306901 RepID=Q2GRG1_CHAGB|nr:uncharacterized protein CHGG_09443 [Chaetomium globosum CBS 148.51]EAQ85429.1 hypothetical protein CHGG_09443 [Chaetomium globosum CBS 148.51]